MQADSAVHGDATVTPRRTPPDQEARYTVVKPHVPSISSEPSSADADHVFGELKRYVGFEEADAHVLRRAAAPLGPFLPGVVEHFYREALANAGARRVFANDQKQIDRLKQALSDWLVTLFSGEYDAQYVRQLSRIGQVHVRVGLSQRYLLVAMEVVRQELGRAIVAAGLDEPEAAMFALHKLLAITCAAMLESYQGAFAEQVRQNERVAVHERLTQAEHLAQIGQLAASLAHEIKNPLAGISGAIQVIRDTMEPDAPHRPILGEVLRQINRLDQTVKDLLVYARPVPPRLSQCNLGGVIERLMTVLRSEPAMQHVRFEHDEGNKPLPTIEADGNQVEQLLLNLVLNAAHASDDDGQVTLRMRASDAGMCLEVEDHGHGMDEQTRRRALEPFFTTKARGTGLGLPICRRIAEAHGGTMSIRSSPGSGTMVTVKLPFRQDASTLEWE